MLSNAFSAMIFCDAVHFAPGTMGVLLCTGIFRNLGSESAVQAREKEGFEAVSCDALILEQCRCYCTVLFLFCTVVLPSGCFALLRVVLYSTEFVLLCHCARPSQWPCCVVCFCAANLCRSHL